jgi:L,D-transpeptidase catalytic domain
MQPADAAVYWSDFDSGYAQPAPPMPQRTQRARRHSGKKVEAQAKEAVKPQGPLIIAISINKQNLRIYDANGFFAETPVSTGMRGHSTPMGVFSIIQKQKFHRSNIYSGAPMPFMERITWSGVAMHAGVLPGYPASHGCIRMPMAFAVKMYGWTRMGARVVVTPGEITPASFSHPLLVAQKAVPLPVASDQPKADASPLSKTDKAANAGATGAPATSEGAPATSEASVEMRSSIRHADRLQADMDVTSVPTPLSEQTHTANAGAVPVGREAVTMFDAAPSSDVTRSATQVADNDSPGNIPTMAASDDTSVEVKSAQPVAPEIITAVVLAADQVGDKMMERPAPASGNAVKADASAGTLAIDVTKAEAKAVDVAAATPSAAAAKTGAEAATDAPAAVPDVKKDQGRLSDVEKAAAANPIMAIASNRGPISVFISRKDAKLYVRQNFAPLFDVPVTIAPGDRPLGTHIFTAEADKTDANILRWSVVSLPSTRSAERRDDDARVSQRRKMAGAPEIRPTPQPDSPAEALDRLTIPADAMARITDALSTAGSIIVSDQGIAAGETGEGTDFIVSLR